MTFHTRGAKRVGYALFGLALAVPCIVSANGREFFAASFATKPDLAYVGSVKDTAGHPLVGAQVIVWAADYGLTFPASTDTTGRYRSPDVGANMKEVTTKVDLKQLRIECAFPGYEQVKRATIPDKSGIVEIDFILKKVGSADTAGRQRPNHAPPTWTWLIPTALVIIVIGAAARR